MLRATKLFRTFSPYLTKQKFCTTQSPLGEPIFEARHSFGQGGTLNTKIKNLNFEIQLKTVWEDHASLKLYSSNEKLANYLNFTENEATCLLEDSELPKELQNHESAVLVAEIPEYYSLDLTNRGGIKFIKGDVSSKLMGNKKFELLDEGSNYSASKVKSEFFEGYIKKGNFEITTFLESADFLLSSEDVNVNVKRLGVSGKASFNLQKGNLNFGSIYTGEKMIRNQQKVATQNLIHISDELDSIENITKGLTENIQKGNYINIDAKNLKMDIGHWQGSSVINTDEANINLKNYEADRILLRANKGEVNLSLSRLGCEGLVYLNQGKLNLFLEKDLKANVFSYKDKKVIGREAVPGLPVLLVYLGENAELKIEEFEKKIFGMFPARVPNRNRA